MASDEEWRARRAAELIGTPFERPNEADRDRMAETLPISRPEPAVFASKKRAVPPSGQNVSPPPQPKASGLRKWALLAGGVAAVTMVAIGLTLLPHRIDQVAPVTRPHPTIDPRKAEQQARVPSVSATEPLPAPDATPLSIGDPTIVAITPPQVKSHHGTAAPTLPVRAASAVSGKQRVATDRSRTHAANVSSHTATPVPIITVSVPRCKATSARVELAICNSSSLLALDRQVHDLSASIIADGDPHLMTKAQKGEASFLRTRDHCKNEACMTRVYSRRIDALQKLRTKASVDQARAAAKALPICEKGQSTSSATCRHRRFSLKRLFGGKLI